MKENRFYVYLHVVDKEFIHKDRQFKLGDVVYVGSGSSVRKDTKRGRTKDHLQLWENLRSVILYDNLTYNEKHRLEIETINKYWDSGKLFNRRKSTLMSRNIDVEIINKYLYYDETSPSCLRWKEKASDKTVVGQVAGTLDSRGYWKVQINKCQFYGHRVVWVLVKKTNIPNQMVINHKDLDRSNSKIDNLECISQELNLKRSKLYARNKSGVRGLWWNANQNYWSASVSIAGKSVKKHFSLVKLLSTTDFQTAKEISKQQAIQWLEETRKGHY